MPRSFLFPALAIVTMLGACNTGPVDNDLERGVVGAGIGAGIAGIAGGDTSDVLVGAGVGAGAGVLCDDAGVCR